MIHKQLLHIENSYQRDLNLNKVREFAACWSWIGCAAIVVAKRDGQFWVVDGQHRVAGANRRSDIAELPCIVFQSKGVEHEASTFLQVNTNRKPIDSIARHRARLAAGDATSLLIESVIKGAGFSVAPNMCTSTKRTVRCVGWCYKQAADNPNAFRKVVHLAAEMAIAEDDSKPLSEKVLQGLSYLHRHCENGLDDPRLVSRIKAVGGIRLNLAAMRAAQLYAAGGAKVWATGMLSEINKGLRYKFTFDEA